MTTTLSDLPIGSVVSFETYAPAILGNKYKNCRVVSHLDAEDARALGSDVMARHASIYPSLPSGTPNTPSGYKFVKVKLVSGGVDYLGVPWIRQETIESQLLNRITVVLENNVGFNDVQKIQDILSAADYSGFKITIDQITEP